MNIGKAIRLCRHQKSMNQSELAERVGISVSYLSLVEQNKRDVSLSTLNKISEALNIPTSILMFLAADKEELKGMNDTLVEKLSRVVLELMDENNTKKT